MANTEALKSGDILGAFGLGNFNFGMGTIGTILLWILISLFILGLIAGVIIFIFYWKTYNQKVQIFGIVGGNPVLKRDDKAKYLRVGKAGDSLFFIRGIKKYVAPPTIQMGKNLWWYWERSDGEYINIGLKDLDEEMRKAGAYFVDADMRFSRVGIEKNLKDRLEKVGFFAKYGVAIATGIFVILVTIALVVLFSKLTSVADAIDGMATNVGTMAENVNRFYVQKVGGETPSNLVPALFLPFIFRRKNGR